MGVRWLSDRSGEWQTTPLDHTASILKTRARLKSVMLTRHEACITTKNSMYVCVCMCMYVCM